MADTLIQPFGEKLLAGDRWKWTLSLADYPADAWKLTYAFRGASSLTIVSTASGIDHLLSASPTATGALDPGNYAWQAVVEKLADATEHYELARGMVQILPDISKAQAGDPTEFRSENQQVLDKVRATIKGTASREEKQYQIGGRSLEVRSVAELLDLETVYAGRVKAEQIAAGTASANSNMVHARFGSPS